MYLYLNNIGSQSDLFLIAIVCKMATTTLLGKLIPPSFPHLKLQFEDHVWIIWPTFTVYKDNKCTL